MRYFEDDPINPATSTRNLVTGSGKKILQTQSGILLEITKKATTADINCHEFVLSDGLIKIFGNQLESVHF